MLKRVILLLSIGLLSSCASGYIDLALDQERKNSATISIVSKFFILYIESLRFTKIVVLNDELNNQPPLYAISSPPGLNHPKSIIISPGKYRITVEWQVGRFPFPEPIRGYNTAIIDAIKGHEYKFYKTQVCDVFINSSTGEKTKLCKKYVSGQGTSKTE